MRPRALLTRGVAAGLFQAQFVHRLMRQKRHVGRGVGVTAAATPGASMMTDTITGKPIAEIPRARRMTSP